MTGADTDAAAREALRLIGPDPANWVADRPGIDHNVVVAGGGQTGTALAFALRRAGVGKVSVIDAAADAAGAGVWLTAARMNLLRTPKGLPGPELGIPALSFQAWYEARHGAAAYAAIERIPRLDWAAYLAWYRQFLGIEVNYGVRLQRIEPTGAGFRLHLLANGAKVTQTARKVVLATGFEGSGAAFVPPLLAALPARLLSHTQDAIDFGSIRGRSVAVVGAAAAAFDAAGAALEHGAAEVHLFARRPAIAAVPASRTRGYPGAYDNFRQLPDRIRWQQALRVRRAGSTPTADAIARAAAFANFHLHLGAPWLAAEADGDSVAARAADGTYRFDHVIAGTGYVAAPSARPELSDFADRILLWRDRFTPPPGDEDAALGAHPYLGEAHEYLEKSVGSAPFLRDIHAPNPAGFVSFGWPVGDVPSMKRDLGLVAARISRDLFLADLDRHEQRMNGAIGADFGPELYAERVWGGGGLPTPP